LNPGGGGGEARMHLSLLIEINCPSSINPAMESRNSTNRVDMGQKLYVTT
jgi:hypothetical protein